MSAPSRDEALNRGSPTRGGRIPRRLVAIGGEQCVLAVLGSVGVVGCLLGLALSPVGNPKPDAAGQLLDLVRVLTTTVLAIVMVLGPGLALRAVRPEHRPRLGFLPLPGMALLALFGAIAWAIGLLGWVHPRIVCVALVAPVRRAFPGSPPTAASGASVGRGIESVLLVAGALGIAVARALWSLGPDGQLYAGSIYQTLEVGDRPDSRIAYLIPELIGNGNSPFGAISRSYYFPYTFSSRGPLPGLAATPLIYSPGVIHRHKSGGRRGCRSTPRDSWPTAWR